MDKPVYLDHNASTPVLPEVREAMLPYMGEHFGNPSSSHPYGRQCRQAVDRARQNVASLLGCSDDEIIFTSGGTESDNLAINGVVRALPQKRHLVTCRVEHPAVVQPCRSLEKQGLDVDWAEVDETGTVNVDEIESALRDDTLLVTIMHANNETGTIMPIARIAEAVHSAGSLLHTDAAQSVGKIPTLVNDMGVDLLTVAGHKFYAPMGIGALYVRRGTPLRPFMLGAGHESGLRPGTENVAGIVGLGEACLLARESLDRESGRQRLLRDELWGILKDGVPGIRLNGHPEQRLPNTLNISFPGVLGSAVLAGAQDVAASTGSACHEGEEESPSEVLSAMGLERTVALGAVRLSLGRLTTGEQIYRAAQSLIRAWQEAIA